MASAAEGCFRGEMRWVSVRCCRSSEGISRWSSHGFVTRDLSLMLLGVSPALQSIQWGVLVVGMIEGDLI
jgi:hypothetical protein